VRNVGSRCRVFSIQKKVSFTSVVAQLAGFLQPLSTKSIIKVEVEKQLFLNGLKRSSIGYRV